MKKRYKPFFEKKSEPYSWLCNICGKIHTTEKRLCAKLKLYEDKVEKEDMTNYYLLIEEESEEAAAEAIESILKNVEKEIKDGKPKYKKQRSRRRRSKRRRSKKRSKY